MQWLLRGKRFGSRVIVLLEILEEQAFKGHREQIIKHEGRKKLYFFFLQFGIATVRKKKTTQRLNVLQGRLLF